MNLRAIHLGMWKKRSKSIMPQVTVGLVAAFLLFNIFENAQPPPKSQAQEGTLVESNSSWDQNTVQGRANRMKEPPATQDGPPHLMVHRMTAGRPPDTYMWQTAFASDFHGNRVVILTDATTAFQHAGSPGAEFVDMDALVERQAEVFEMLRTFRQSYKPWGLKEPWERENIERFFYIAAFALDRHLQRVFYTDTDVALLTRVSDLKLPKSCDYLVSIPKQTFESYFWVVWAGTALLDQQVLMQFLRFVLRIYSSPQVMALLTTKERIAPYVCDMSLWFLFAISADPGLASLVSSPASLPLPKPANRSRACDLVALGFDHMHAHTRKGFVLDRDTLTAWDSEQKERKRIKSVHFQGSAKGFASVLVEAKPTQFHAFRSVLAKRQRF
ncbi:hypothetical protein GUITHDRAFT_121411 [Guillardia theta CCMP2712]|uniref:Nucleotide-diphospho-sugar transferase domain-containing protein n=1 Tax=Guillardia theta (strain CCMP2712) TaxID=905079 RepID=L1I823_GUITC|nr:hypothetical protein GUITHDRAFT_121411 [Guillardia theta CCMP2712]EKX32406.1 hypothetical protein GUITHDRAFT_121411 [Guillardia theta CCMP2712]|eukprot:XP_005819386.1 hypothetical protein GUITHDRAFT_121411 [Guillardia theta CCMP2712]